MEQLNKKITEGIILEVVIHGHLLQVESTCGINHKTKNKNKNGKKKNIVGGCFSF